MSPLEPKAVAVYCGSSIGAHQAFARAAESLGKAIAEDGYNLVYGGGAMGIMGVVSGAVSDAGGFVTGIVPRAMVKAGGEGSQVDSGSVRLQANTDKFETIVVDSMHERKVEMAKRSAGFVALPGGFGTFEELMEVTTWTQIGIHNKPVVVANVRGFYEPLRLLIRNGIENGFIQPRNESLIVFVDGPESIEEHDTFDWGTASMNALQSWESSDIVPLFKWTDGQDAKDGALSAS